MSNSDKNPIEGCEKRSGLEQLGPVLPYPLLEGVQCLQTLDGKPVVLTEGGPYILEDNEWVSLSEYRE